MIYYSVVSTPFRDIVHGPRVVAKTLLINITVIDNTILYMLPLLRQIVALHTVVYKWKIWQERDWRPQTAETTIKRSSYKKMTFDKSTKYAARLVSETPINTTQQYVQLPFSFSRRTVHYTADTWTLFLCILRFWIQRHLICHPTYMQSKLLHIGIFFPPLRSYLAFSLTPPCLFGVFF